MYPLSTVSTISDTVILILAMASHFLDYFVEDNELTAGGNVIAGSITDVVRSIAHFTNYLPDFLGNVVG